MTKLKLLVGNLTLGVIFAQPVITTAQTQSSIERPKENRTLTINVITTPRRWWGVQRQAVVGGLMGGGKGALIGGAVGAGGGVVADKVRKHQGVKKRERRENPR